MVFIFTKMGFQFSNQICLHGIQYMQAKNLMNLNAVARTATFLWVEIDLKRKIIINLPRAGVLGLWMNVMRCSLADSWRGFQSKIAIPWLLCWGEVLVSINMTPRLAQGQVAPTSYYGIPAITSFNKGQINVSNGLFNASSMVFIWSYLDYFNYFHIISFFFMNILIISKFKCRKRISAHHLFMLSQPKHCFLHSDGWKAEFPSKRIWEMMNNSIIFNIYFTMVLKMRFGWPFIHTIKTSEMELAIWNPALSKASGPVSHAESTNAPLTIALPSILTILLDVGKSIPVKVNGIQCMLKLKNYQV